MKFYQFILGVFLIVSTTSCAIKESIVFNNDNSGKINYTFDMSKLMSMGDMIGDKKEKKAEENFEKVSKKIDSTFSMKELFASKKDSISRLPKDEQDKYKKMERFMVHMIVDEANDKMQYEMYADFKNIKEFTDLTSPLNSMTELSPVGNDIPTNDLAKNDSKTNYYFDGKKFSKKVTGMTKDEITNGYKDGLVNEGLDNEESEDLSQKMTESLDMMMSQSNYEMIVTFPKKIKKISIKNAKVSEDKKTVAITYSMKDYMESNNLDFEVELEK